MKKWLFLVILILSVIFILYLSFSTNYDFIFTDGKIVIQSNCKDLHINPKNKIVILSETTHGSENIRFLNTCIVKYLFKNKNFSTVILEWDYSDISYVNSYIKGNSQISTSLIASIFKNTLFDSRDFFELIEWAKNQNKIGAKIEFFGMDNWGTNKNLRKSDIVKHNRLSISKINELNILKSCIKENKIGSKIYKNCNYIILKYIKNKQPNVSKKDYYFWLVERWLLSLNYIKSFPGKFNYYRDLNMFKTFEDILNYKNKTQKDDGIIVLTHMGHGLNYPGKFGSYLHKSRHNFSSYIVSLCKGKITSYKEGTRKYYDLEISDLEKDLIENSICSGNLFNKNINNKILHYPSAFTPNFINDIPDFNFEGFFVVPNSRPLEFSK